MRPLIKTANKFDTVWTMVVMFPAFMLFFNAVIALHQGTATPSDLTGAANKVAVKFTGQYMPYIETTSAALLTGVEKLSAAVTFCAGHSSGPVYTNPAIARSQGCALTRMFKSTNPSITPYNTYR